jgi:hypothetical protein
MENQFKPGTRKALGVPLSGSGASEIVAVDSTVAVATTAKTPIFTQEIGNLSLMLSQKWVNNAVALEVFSDNAYRRGFVISNNDVNTVYIGTTDDPILLKKIGMPIYTKSSFSSAGYQGKLYIVADDSCAGVDQDVRVWEEQL